MLLVTDRMGRVRHVTKALAKLLDSTPEGLEVNPLGAQWDIGAISFLIFKCRCDLPVRIQMSILSPCTYSNALFQMIWRRF